MLDMCCLIALSYRVVKFKGFQWAQVKMQMLKGRLHKLKDQIQISMGF